MYDPNSPTHSTNGASPSPSPGAQCAPGSATRQTAAPAGSGDDHWPKEEQRLCNGACGQVPKANQRIQTHERVERKRRSAMGSGPNQPSDGGASMSSETQPEWLALEWLRTPPAPTETATPVHVAIDVADSMLCESLDMAQHLIGHSASARREVLTLTAAHLQSASIVYAANQIVTALRELTPEIAGAISEAGTDIGSGVAEGLQQALNTGTHDNTNNS